MKNSAYWKKRFELIEQMQNQQGVQCYMDIEKQYRKAQQQLEGQILAWYGRFATNNNISMVEARKMLTSKELAEFKWDVNQYIRYGEENAINGTWIKQLENASARYHNSRLEALKIQTQQSIEVMFGNQLDSIDGAMRDIYTSGYYHTAFEVQKGVGVAWDFTTLNEKQISKIINKPWTADGKNFSERVWGNRQKLVNELNTTLTQNIILGKDPQKAIDEISRKMGTSKKAAGKLVMTEEAFFSSASQRDCFTELDVEQFEVVATLDSHTSDICQSMDGKHFPMSQYEVGVTAPPFHVYCRSTTVPFFDDEFDSVGERAAKDADGKTYFVPSSMKYDDWKKSFVDGDKSGLQEVDKKLTNEQIDAKIGNLKKQQSDISGWGDYDTVEKDWGSIDDYFSEDDAETIEAKSQFLKYQKEIESLQQKRTGDTMKADKSVNAPTMIGGVNCNVYSGQFQFGNGTANNTNKARKAVTYETPDSTKFVFPNSYDKQKQGMTPEKAISLYQKVPQKLREMGQDTIEFVDYYNPQDRYWRKKYKNFTHSYATGGTDRLTFYRHSTHNDDYVVGTYCHEIGHKVDIDLGVNSVRISEDTDWVAAMAADKAHSGLVSPTTYGANANTEDFAESMAEYIANPVDFKKNFPNRAKIIENILTS